MLPLLLRLLLLGWLLLCLCWRLLAQVAGVSHARGRLRCGLG